MSMHGGARQKGLNRVIRRVRQGGREKRWARRLSFTPGAAARLAEAQSHKRVLAETKSALRERLGT